MHVVCTSPYQDEIPWTAYFVWFAQVDLNAHTQMFPPLVPRAISPARPSMAEHQQAPTSTPPPVEDQEPANGLRPISSSPSVTEPSPMMPMESPMSPAPKPEQLGKSMSRLNTISTRSAEPVSRVYFRQSTQVLTFCSIHSLPRWYSQSATLDLDAVRRLATMKPEVWEGIHLPGKVWIPQNLSNLSSIIFFLPACMHTSIPSRTTIATWPSLSPGCSLQCPW